MTFKRTESQEKKPAGKIPDFYVYTVKEGKNEGDKGFWTKLGVAYLHGNGEGLNIQLDAVPLDGRLVLRIPTKSEA